MKGGDISSGQSPVDHSIPFARGAYRAPVGRGQWDSAAPAPGRRRRLASGINSTSPPVSDRPYRPTRKMRLVATPMA